MFNPTNDNQLWRQDSKGRLINKANGKVFMWDRYGPKFQVFYFDYVFLNLHKTLYVRRLLTLDLNGASTDVLDLPKTEVQSDRSYKQSMDQKTAV